MDTFYMKQGDTSPVLAATLLNPDATAADLTGATVKFSMKTVAGTVLINKAACTVVSAAAGTVEYAWTSGDTDTPGIHLAEFEVTFSDLTVESFPNKDYFRVNITKQIA